MPVVSVSMPDSLLTEFDEFIEEHGYSGRSEAVREGTRGLLEESVEQDFDGQHVICIIKTIFDHDPEVEGTFSELYHANEDLVTSKVHTHAGNACLELFVAEGPAHEVETYIGRLRAVDGVTTVKSSVLAADQPALD